MNKAKQRLNLPTLLRNALVDEIAQLPETEVACLMSSGVDSHTTLFASLEAGKRVTTYSFTLDDRESRDFLMAKNTAKVFGLPFKKVVLPTNRRQLLYDVEFLIAELNCTKKTHIECMWPMMYAIDAVKESSIITGHGADNYYCLSRKAYQHYHGRWDEYRALSFADPFWSQKAYTNAYGSEQGKKFAYPYHSKRVFRVFEGTSYEDLNKPHQKSVSREAFAPELSKCKVYTHMPFQLGDSGIAAHFEHLISMSCNSNDSKSVVGVYNQIRRGFNA